MPPVETPEALWLGMPPTDGQLRQGPLNVAALGADPPERSIHFHVTPMAFADGVATEIPFEITPEDQRVLMEAAKRLNTSLLTLVEGESLDHGLVWESLGDLGTNPASVVSGKAVRDFLPEGDGEPTLRRFIDDSINLLSDLTLNEERLDQGLPQINLLWPWGHGVRKKVPNLALRRGEPALVLSSSLRLAGLSRLAGYRHCERAAFGRALNTRMEWALKEIRTADLTITLIDASTVLAEGERDEELAWLGREIDQKILKPLLDDSLTGKTRVSLLCPSEGVGLGVKFESGDHGSGSIPFDERALEERSLPTRDLWDSVVTSIS